MKTITEQKRSKLIRKYHMLNKQLGIPEEDRKAMLNDNYGVKSSKDLYTEELEHICNFLQEDLDKQDEKQKKARRRVFGAVGGWLDLVYGKVSELNNDKYKERVDKIKAIACRQTEIEDFNKIPTERLNNVSHLFSNKQKDYKQGKVVVSEEMAELASLN